MKSVRNIIGEKSASSLLSMFIIISLCSACDSKEKAFEQRIKEHSVGLLYDLVLPLLIYTNDSATLLVQTTRDSMVEEICDFSGIDEKNAKDILYDSFKQKIPIQVSPSFYNYCLNKCVIKVDLKVDSIYKKNGIRGILNCYYHQNENGLTYFDSFPPLMNEGTLDIGYIIYLLSLHDTYICDFWIDEDCLIVRTIDEKISAITE